VPWLLCLFGTLPGAGALAAEAPRIVDLQAQHVDGAYRTSFRLDGAFDQYVLDTIASGLPVAFQYRVEVLQNRAMWTDLLQLRRNVKVTVDFDSLTSQYQLTREVDGQVVDSASTDRPEDMRRWMTQVTALDLGSLPEATESAGRRTLRVKCRLLSRFSFFFFPRAVETKWARTLLPAPAPPEAEAP
jgi:hypothetical protein